MSKIIYITSLNGSKMEPLNNISTDFRMEQAVDGTFTVSFSCLAENNPGYALLENKATITVDGYDFTIEQSSGSIYAKKIVAISTFYKLAKKRQNAFLNGARTLNERVAFTLASAGWTYSIDSAIINKTVTIPQFGRNNIVSLITTLCAEYECEYVIQRNNHLHFATEVGPDNDYQYRYKHNISDVELSIDTTNLFTRITGEGKDGLTVTYTSPNATMFGVLEADPIKDERYTNSGALTNYIRNQLNDVPDLAIQSTTPELTSREIGERVWVIHEPLGIEMKTRILKQTKVLRNNELITSNVIFGTSLPKTITTQFVESKREYRSKFEQTDDRITMEVEQIDQSIATIDIKADNIALSVSDLSNSTNASIATLNIRSNNIELSVNNLSTNVYSTISVMQDRIDLKVNSNGVISAINLSPESISINSSKINLNGAVMVNGSITGSTNLNITQDIYVGNNVYLALGRDTTKSIIFSETSRINGSFWNMEISSPQLSIGTSTTFLGTVDFSRATVIGLP